MRENIIFVVQLLAKEGYAEWLVDSRCSVEKLL